MRRWGPIAVVGVLSMSCLSGGLAGALGVAAVDHVQNTERTPTVSFENRHSEPVCGINLWRPSQPESESDANWLELTDLLKLEPGQRVTVGIVPKDGAYRLRALGCGARGFSLSDVVIPQVVPGTTLVLGAPEPAPVRAPLPSTVGL
ncbi:MAG: hypothetical protein MUC96_03570 [Myxococcaceae bacterium]|jgi:hypothetical protein|nr:hypothetical protein [Myxococcaceae bacterium]